MSKPQQAEKTKKVKAPVLSEDGDLTYALIDVPLSDKRPAWAGEALVHDKNIGSGNPEGDKAGALKGF